jgi:LmbE family N-acetylglucosaminyl deacetylase
VASSGAAIAAEYRVGAAPRIPENEKEQLMTTARADAPMTAGSYPAMMLPRGVSVLTVTTRPGKESLELGGLLYAFRREGAGLSLLSLSRGEGAPANSRSARLEAIRPWELQLAATVLGISEVVVASYPDGTLHQQPEAELACRIGRAIRQHSVDLVLIVAPEAGDRDDAAVARAAEAAAAGVGVPVVASTRPDTPGAWLIDLGDDAPTARAIQRAAVAAHASQSAILPDLLRRLAMIGGHEAVRWVLFPLSLPAQLEREAPAAVWWG